VPPYPYAKDAKSAFVVVKGDTLDQTGDFFGHGLALRCCGIHVEETKSGGSKGGNY
jgi:hypothetical protein